MAKSLIQKKRLGLVDHLEIVLPQYPPLHQHPCDKLDVVLVMVQEQAGCVVVLGNGGTRVPLSYLLGFYRRSRSPAIAQILAFASRWTVRWSQLPNAHLFCSSS